MKIIILNDIILYSKSLTYYIVYSLMKYNYAGTEIF